MVKNLKHCPNCGAEMSLARESTTINWIESIFMEMRLWICPKCGKWNNIIQKEPK